MLKKIPQDKENDTIWKLRYKEMESIENDEWMNMKDYALFFFKRQLTI